jgi:hypothetical protein
VDIPAQHRRVQTAGGKLNCGFATWALAEAGGAGSCRRLVIGTERLPVMEEVKQETLLRKIDPLILPTDEALEALARKTDRANAILYVTC